MTDRGRRFAIVIALAGGVIAVAAVAAKRLAPGWLRGTIERAAAEALGRELKIAGALDLSLSLTPTLAASNVTLANAPWGSEPFMARAGRISVSVDLISLWSRPVRVRDLAVEDVRVLLETDPQGRGNWAFETQAATGGPPSFRIERAAVRGLELVVRAGPGALPLKAGITALDAGLDPATRMIGVRGGGHLGGVPWDVAGQLGPLESLRAVRDVDHALTGHVGQSAFSVSGRIHDPMTLDGPDVHVRVDGPDIVAALAVLGLKSSLAGPFRLEARLAPKDGAVEAELSGALGGVTAKARGKLESLPRPGRITAEVEAAGPDAAVVGSWTGVEGLPPRPFDVAGRLRREGRRLFFDDLKVRVGGTSLDVTGTVGEPPRCVGTELLVAATGTDLSELSALTRLRLPRGAFKAGGRFLRRADGLAIEAVELGVDGARIHAAGTIGEPPGLANLDLTADGTGEDASILSGVARVALPAEPFEIRGRVTRSGPALELDGVAGRLGDRVFDVSGRLVPVRGLVGTDARVRVAGGDLSRSASYVGLRGLPAEPFDAAGRVRVLADAYELEGVEARVGGLSGTAEGRLGAPTPLDGTSLACRVRGSALSGLAAWGVATKLPSEPFVASGRLGIDGGVYRVDGLAVDVGAIRVAVDGALGALPDVAALDVAVRASGPDLAALGRFLAAAGVQPPARIPAEPFTVTGRVRRVTAGVEIRDTRAEVGSLKLGASGTVGLAEHLLGTDVRFEAEAPDTRVLSRALGVTLPEGPLRARGRVLRALDDLRLEATEVWIGAARAEARGTFGVRPGLEGSDFEVSVEGPDLAAMLGPPTGLDPLPVDAFALSAHLLGSPGGIASDRFHARLGDSDLEGSVSVRLGDRPFVEADLRSRHLDAHRPGGEPGRPPDTGEKEVEPAGKKGGEDDRVIPDRPFSFQALRAVDGRLRLAVDEVTFPGVEVRDVEITGELHDGALTLDHIGVTGVTGGRVTGNLSLVPQGDGYGVRVEARVQDARLVLPSVESRESAPSLDMEYELSGVGRSLREVAASADGRALVMIGAGRVPTTRVDRASSGVLTALLDALNPFRKSSSCTEFECGVAAAGIDGGKVVVEPIAFRTDKVTVVGHGRLDLGTEDVDLVWTIKPRSHAGISGGSIANPYIRLGGTLGSPRLEMKPLKAAASTGAAVATLGMTILYRGIYNRITAEKKVCVDALAQSRKAEDERAARKAAKPRE